MADTDLTNPIPKINYNGMKLSHQPLRMAQAARKKIISILANGCPCGSEKATLRQRSYINATITVHLQCDGCGKSLSGSMKRSEHYFFKDYTQWDGDLQEAGAESYRSQYNEQNEERDAAYRDRQQEYQEIFLKSDEWREMRAKVLKRAGLTCEACLGAPATEVHHDGYSFGVAPPMWQLRAICRRCHERVTFGWHTFKSPKNDESDEL